jgi:hypothetical protein
MPICQFGERQYELAANLELIAGSGRFFAPTTTVEGALGIDAALTPGHPAIWQILGVPAPHGVRAGPAVFAGWPGAAGRASSPPFLLSLFVQYKRSAYLTRSWAKEWGTHTAPYWRIELAARQHSRLQQLEQAVGGQAVVRYAAPKFWRHEEMWQFQGLGAVMDNSLLVAPSDIHRRHSRITWSHAAGSVGHSESEPIRAETAEMLGEEVRRRARVRTDTPVRETPRAHLDSLAASLEELTPSRRRREGWVEAVAARALREEEGPPVDETVEALADIAVVAEVAYAARASWLILSFSQSPAHQGGG